MAIQVQGNGGVVLESEGSTFRALRITGKPQDPGTLGCYSLAMVSGVMAAGIAANSEIFQMRWTNATNLMVLRSVTVSVSKGTTAFTAGPGELSLTCARSWSADGTGGNAVVFSTANTNKKRTSFPLSLFSDTGVRSASTAALGAGTKTLDTNKFASVSVFVSSGTTAVPEVILPSTVIWQRNTHDEYPFVFAQNEGFVLRVTLPATGTWQFSVQPEWAELAAF